MPSIDNHVEHAVLEDFRRRSAGEDAFVGAQYAYDLVRVLYDEAKFGPYPPALSAALGLIGDAAVSAYTDEFARSRA